MTSGVRQRVGLQVGGDLIVPVQAGPRARPVPGHQQLIRPRTFEEPKKARNLDRNRP